MDEKEADFTVLFSRLQRAAVVGEIYTAAGLDEEAEAILRVCETLINDIRIFMVKKKKSIGSKVIKSIPVGTDTKNQGTKPSKKSGNKC